MLICPGKVGKSPHNVPAYGYAKRDVVDSAVGSLVEEFSLPADATATSLRCPVQVAPLLDEFAGLPRDSRN